MKYEFIHREQLPYPIRIQCRVLEVHHSGYYAWVNKQQNGTHGKRATENAALLQEIEQIQTETKSRYGAPRVTAVLRKRGHGVSRGRVARLMKANNIKARVRKSFRVTTRSNHRLASPRLPVRGSLIVATPSSENSFPSFLTSAGVRLKSIR